jgi:hypothetical protein
MSSDLSNCGCARTRKRNAESAHHFLSARRRSCPLLLLVFVFLFSQNAFSQDRDDEIVADLAGGRVIVHVARDTIIFAAIDKPVEAQSIPPRVMNLDSTHIGVLFGASEWQNPADPNPIRLDRNLPHIGPRDPRYAVSPDEGAPDLESMGVAFLEELRPLVARLHHKLDFKPDAPLFQLVIIGFAPEDYGAEVWTADYRIEQEEVATKSEYWQTRILRPRFTQLYPPEKHAPRTLVEVRYPDNAKGPSFVDLIQGNDPRIARLAASDPHYAKVLEEIERGEAQKAVPTDATDFLRAVLPLIAGNSRFVLGTMDDRGGLDWIVPPDEPIEKAQEDKNRPPETPSLRRKPQP